VNGRVFSRQSDKEEPVNTEHGPKKTSWEKRQEEEERRKRHRRKSEESSDTLYTVFGYLAYQAYMLMGSREAEYEADLYGTHFSFAAGYDVRGSLALQKLFIKVHEGDGENTSGLEWISTHPDPLNRLGANAETVNAIFKEHGCYKKVDV
jgi:predicted Zn-dependent protease